MAIFRKELNSELRSRSGLVTAGLFSLVTVVAISIAAYNLKLSGTLAAGLMWVAILFASVASLPRVFLLEEEQGTGDLLRLMARPHAVFWGKALFNLVQTILTGFFLSFLFFGFIGMSVTIPWLYVLSLFSGCAALSGAVTLCGALVAQAANRSALAGAIAVPLLLPVVFIGVSSMRVALGQGFVQDGISTGIGLSGYAVVTLALGPGLFALVWKH